MYLIHVDGVLIDSHLFLIEGLFKNKKQKRNHSKVKLGVTSAGQTN